MVSNYEASRLLDLETAQDQRGDMINVILDSIKQVKPIEKGFGLKFGPEDEDLLLVMDWIYIERKCNPFLRFVLKAESNKGPLWVHISGPEGTKDFLKSEYALSRWL